MKTYDMEALTHIWSPFSKLLSPLENETEFEETRAFLDQLIDMVGGNENHPLASLMYHVGNLVDVYEERDEDLSDLGKKGDAITMLKFLMDQHGLKQVDLSDVFGSQGNASEVLRGKRDLNLKHIKKLSKKFGVDASVFLD
ncbi:MAG: helix-turn-helix domain-containing protein [SAR324 cluster bacterium]|nr:helix-turn-helix domain-containing protein [SAR324 cluster bacterium]